MKASPLTEAAQRIVLRNTSADERLRPVMKTYLESLQVNKSLSMKWSLDAQRLNLDSQKQIHKKRHAYQDLIRSLIEECTRQSAFCKIDPCLVARMCINNPCASCLHPAPYENRAGNAGRDDGHFPQGH